jgi:hypothetical protein
MRNYDSIAPLASVKSRAWIVLTALFYMAALYFSYHFYLSPKWGYFGFSYQPWTLDDAIFAVGMTVWSGLLIPTGLNYASSLIVTLLYIVVYIPAVIVMLSLDVNGIEVYGEILIALGIGFGMICLGARSPAIFSWPRIRISWMSIVISMLIAWAACLLILFYYYGSSMKFVGMDEIYIQRFASREISAPGLGYVRSFFINVFCTFFMAYGLISRYWYWFILGAIGCLLMYMITAEKSMFIFPFAFLGLNFILRQDSVVYKQTWFTLGLFGCVVVLCTVMYDQGASWGWLATLFVFRVLAIPGLMLPMYYDLFSAEGFTWWSHVKGISQFVPAPENFVNDPTWPFLGLIVGERMFGKAGVNGNANLWAGDGIAAAGAFGIVAISLLLAVWLHTINESTRQWNKNFTILALFPYTLSLMNGHFFTGLLSFGGFAWIAFFALIDCRRDCPMGLHVRNDTEVIANQTDKEQ